MRRRGAIAAAVVLGLLPRPLLAACGGGHTHVTPPSTPHRHRRSTTLYVYSSLPEYGPEAARTQAIERGIHVALTAVLLTLHRWTIDYRPLNDADPSGAWDPTLVAQNAERAATNAGSILYIGDVSSGANAISSAILAAAGIPQISLGPTPTTTTTAPRPPAATTFLRLVPSIEVEAAADLTAMADDDCRVAAVAAGSAADSRTLIGLVESYSRSYPVRILGGAGIMLDPAQGAQARAYAALVAHLGAQCFFYAGAPTSAAVQLALDVHTALLPTLPHASIIGSLGVCTTAWTAPLVAGGIAPANVQCSAPTPNLSAATPGPRATTGPGARFLADYLAQYHVENPDLMAVYGFEAMRIGLDAVSSQGSNGDNRTDVLKALLATQATAATSAIGPFTFGPTGASTIRNYSLYSATADGGLVWRRTVVRPYVP